MNRREKMHLLTEEGFRAALAGLPCEFPGRKEIERAAWEIGWRAGRREYDAIAAKRKAREAYEAFREKLDL